MFVIRLLILLSLFFTTSFSKGEVSKIFAHKESATATTYSANGHNYKWGEGDNIVIDGFEYNGHHYNYLSNSTIIKIRRVDNAQSSGTPCGLFAERKGGDAYKLEANYPQTNGNCDMAKVMGGRIINVGALDLFKNVSDGWDTAKNIERVDFISPKGIVAPAKSADLSRAGHVVTEKSGNNEIRIAPILSIDANNNPTSYGTLVRVMPYGSSSSFVRYKNCSIELSDGSSSYKRKLGFYRDNKKTSQGQQGNAWYLGNSYEPMGMAFVSLDELGISAGERYYGFSYFGRDVTSAMDLTDISTFPHDTSGDTADPYGGVASYFVDKELGYGTCYGMIDDGRSLYEMDLSSNTLFNERKISTEFVGEGTAYRATNHKLYVFQTYKNGTTIDKHGDSSSLYSIDLNSNITPIVPYKEQDNIVSDEVEGAEFYYNSATKKEILYIITSKKQVKNTYSLHAFYADNWTQELSGYPKVINNYRLDSLAIDPNTGQGYGIDDAGKTTAPKVYKLNLATGVATFLFQATDEYDAEGLAFAIDGKLYAEDEGGYSKLSRKIYRVDLEQKKFIEVRNLSGTKDIEGLSCNGVHSAPVAKGAISGVVFEDPNGDGVLSDKVLKSNVKVRLYKDSNSDGVPNGGDFVKEIKTDGQGEYKFTNVANGKYHVVIDSKTVMPNETYQGSSILAEQTYAPKGGLCGNNTPLDSAGSCYGGRSATGSDDISSWSTKEHVASIEVSGAEVKDVDFGFSFDVVVNVNDSGQGSFRQFLHNANSIDRVNHMRFVPSVAPNSNNKWWTLKLLSALPKLATNNGVGDGFVIDGKAYNSDGTVRDSNSGTVGHSGVNVGTGADGVTNTGDEATLPNFEKKEFEIDANGKFGSIKDSENHTRKGVFIIADDAITIKNIALFNALDNNNYSSAGFVLDGGNINITQNLIGCRADGSSPSLSKRLENAIYHGKTSGKLIEISRNYIAFIKYTGIWAGRASNIYLNDLYKASMSPTGDAITTEESTGNSINILNNWIEGSSAYGVESWESPSTITIVGNTFAKNGADTSGANQGENGSIRMYGSGNIILNNIIQKSTKAGVVLVGAKNGNKISKNSFQKKQHS